MSSLTQDDLDKFKQQMVMLVANGNKQQSDSVLEQVKNQQKMDLILAIMELLEIDNLDFITEHPNTNYVKQITKLETLRQHQAEHFDLDINDMWDSPNMRKDEDKTIKPMVRCWKINMISHKRKRPQEIIAGVKQQDINYNLGIEPSRRKKFLGLI